MVLEWIARYWDAFFSMTVEMAPYLLLGFFIAGILRVFVPRSLYSKHLSRPGMKSVVKAAALGVPLPLCSCGVIPTTASLRKEGASRASCISFLIATPQTGVDSIVATYSLMGLPFAVVRPIAALVTAMLGGWMVGKYVPEDKEKADEQGASSKQQACGLNEQGQTSLPSHHAPCSSEQASEHKSFWAKVKEAFAYAFGEMMEDVGKWLVIGLFIAALITVAVPNDWLAALHDYKLLNMIIVLAVSIPMYVCATGSIPIAVSLMAKGLTPGAGLVLLMAGPAVNSASILVIGKVFGRRTLRCYLLSIIIGAMLFGLCIDYLLPAEWFAVKDYVCTDGCHDGGISWFSLLCTALLAVLLVRALWPFGHHHHHHHETEEAESCILTLYHIEGMRCNHCAENVEKAIASVDGVEKVHVSLSDGTASISGSPNDDDIIRAVESIGFQASRKE